MKMIFLFNFVHNLQKDLRRQQIGAKIQSFHVNDLKKDLARQQIDEKINY